MEEWILKALQLGMTGFAVVFLFLGFKLYWKLLTGKPRNQDLSLYKIKLREGKVYLGFSIIILVIGIVATIVIKDIKYELILKIDPGIFDEEVSVPTVHVTDKIFVLDATQHGLLRLNIKNEEVIVVSIEELINHYKGKLADFVKGGGGKSQINNSRDGGFSGEI